MQISIRGWKVRTKRVTNDLYEPRKYTFNPKTGNTKQDIIFGFNKRNRRDFGAMLYNKGRLIKFGLKVGFMTSPDSRGLGVLVVVNADYLQPTHNKQEFIDSDHYRLLVSMMGQKLRAYWTEIVPKGMIGQFWPELDAMAKLGPFWHQCGKCLKWRKLEKKQYADLWDCSMNPNPEYSNCTIPEEDIQFKKKARPKLLKLPDGTLASDTNVVMIDGMAVEINDLSSDRPKRNAKRSSKLDLEEEYLLSMEQKSRKRKVPPKKKTKHECENCKKNLRRS